MWIYIYPSLKIVFALVHHTHGRCGQVKAHGIHAFVVVLVDGGRRHGCRPWSTCIGDRMGYGYVTCACNCTPGMQCQLPTEQESSCFCFQQRRWWMDPSSGPAAGLECMIEWRRRRRDPAGQVRSVAVAGVGSSPASCFGLVWFSAPRSIRKFWPLITVSNKSNL